MAALEAARLRERRREGEREREREKLAFRVRRLRKTTCGVDWMETNGICSGRDNEREGRGIMCTEEEKKGGGSSEQL
jgi:hypothetical protein